MKNAKSSRPPTLSVRALVGSGAVASLIIIVGIIAFWQRPAVLQLLPETWRNAVAFPAAQTVVIRQTEHGFEPMTVSIHPGDIVRFENHTDQFFWPASDIHPTHEVYPEFDPRQPISPREAWSFRFTQVGRWNFHDHLAPMWTGSIDVRPLDVAAATSAERPTEVAAAADVRHWQERIQALGADPAYQELKKDYATKSYGEQHTAAHAFGTALYLEKGSGGVGACDESFGFGCYHTFFGTAIQREGEGIIKTLDAACIARWGKLGLGCQHGIGHGIMAAFGTQRLNDALKACATLNWQGDFGGCSGGVFMEYHVQSMDVKNAGQPREPNTALREPDRYFDPCPNVIEKYRAACYFEISQWWLSLFPNNVQKAGQLCALLPASVSPYDRAACYRGIGKNTVPTRLQDITVDLVIANCSLMPNREAVMQCREGSMWTFFSQPGQEKAVQQLCTQDVQSEALRIECFQYQQLVRYGK